MEIPPPNASTKSPIGEAQQPASTGSATVLRQAQQPCFDKVPDRVGNPLTELSPAGKRWVGLGVTPELVYGLVCCLIPGSTPTAGAEYLKNFNESVTAFPLHSANRAEMKSGSPPFFQTHIPAMRYNHCICISLSKKRSTCPDNKAD
jgi:hypothetical protein